MYNYDNISILEKEGKYLMAIESLYGAWKSNREESKLLVRLAFECWYALSEQENLNISDEQFAKVQSILMELKDYVVDNNVRDTYVLSHLGYMMSMFPYLFYANDKEDQYVEIEKIGISMMKRAIEIDPTNQIAQLFKMGSESASKSYNKLRKQLKPQIEREYSGDSCFDEYFRDVLTL